MSSHCRILLAAFPLALLASLVPRVRADPIISEFMASNTKTLADKDGEFNDWIELYNPDATAANLSGWYLTDVATNKVKWQFPAVTLPAGGYLVVFASNKNLRDPAAQLHTNFSLDGDGEYLALVKPDGSTVTTEFAPKFPAQSPDVSYGITQPTATGETPRLGYFAVATPAARNSGGDGLLVLDRVTFSRASGPFAGSVSITLGGAVTGQRIRYVVSAPSTAGATVADPTAASTEYTAPITISSSVIIRAAIFSGDNAQRGPATSAHYVHLSTSGAASLSSFSSQLPLMVIDTHGTGALLKDEIDHPSWTYTWDRPTSGSNALTTTPTSATSSTTRVHGASSSDFPKKSYNLDLTDSAGKSNPVALAGLGKFSSWVLAGPWSYDRTLMHNAFVYALSNRLGRWAPHTQIVEVFVNADGGDLEATDYAGVYTLTDALDIDPLRVDLTALDKGDTGDTKITGGYLLKVDLADTTELSFRTTRGFPAAPVAVVVDKPKLSGLAASQRTYIQNYIQGFEDALYTSYLGGWTQRSYLDYIKRSSWVDHHLLNTLTMNVDAFQRSAYLMKERGERMTAGPVWDFDRALGGGEVRTDNPSQWNGPDNATEVWAFGWWGLLARDPEFMQDWIDRWQILRRTELATSSLNTLVDSIAAQIGPDAAARDTARWPDNASRFPGGWQGEIDNMKSWLARRTAWIDSQFRAAPTITTSGSNIVVTPAPGTQLAYTTDGTDPRVLGPAVSPSATLSPAPVTLPATVNVQARSYDASFDPNTVPGSAWSSIARGPNSTSTLPRPFLSNLSILTDLAVGDNFTMGFVVGGLGTGGPKPLVMRAAGPSLSQFGVGNPLSDPKLEFYTGSKKTSDNNNWGGDSAIVDAFAQVGAFPFASAGSKDAAIYDPAVALGGNSVVVSGAAATSGVVIAELYDATAPQNQFPSSPRLINVSVLKNLGDGLTVGFVVAPVGGPAKRVLIRAIGPTLGAPPFGVPGVVIDPQMALFGAAGQLSANDNWGGTAELTAAFNSVGAFLLPADSKDAALVATLTPGSYTVQVKGVNSTTGLALVEVYELP